MNWFNIHDIRLVRWPGRSPDINLIENLWAMLFTDVYSRGKQCESLGESRSMVKNMWRNSLFLFLTSLSISCARGVPRRYLVR